jgi:dipeptidyl aminopeptidase/acylaminoacyl peptidase
MVRSLTSRELLSLEAVDDPQLSPDGERVAWVKTGMVAEENRYRATILITEISSGETWRLNSDEVQASHPRWSPDGRAIAYLVRPTGQSGTPRGDGRPQLELIAATGGVPKRLTALSGGVAEHAWAPSGDRIAFTTLVDPELGLEPPPNDAEDSDPFLRFNRDVIIAKRLKWKFDGQGYLGAMRRQVALVPCNVDALDDGGTDKPPPVTLLTDGPNDFSGPVWSPRSDALAVVGNVRPDEDRVRRRYLYLLDATRLGPPRELIGLEDIRHDGLSWSPDGARIALTGHNDATIGHYGNQQLWLVEVASGEATCLSAGFDWTLGNAANSATDIGGYGGESGVRWSPGGRALLALVSDRGQVCLTRFSLQGDDPVSLTPEGALVAAFTIDSQGARAAILLRASSDPGNVHLLELAGEGRETPKRLTDVNLAVLAELDFSPPQPFRVESDETEIDAWMIAPPAHRTVEPCPVILYTGGGPGGMRTAAYMFEFQLLASQGYAVVYGNVRGCQGYGEAFCTAILGDWGSADYRDNLGIVEAACARYSFLDPSRQAIAGGSYGGYLVNRAIGHTRRFRAAVSDRSVTNRYASFGSSDIGHLREFEFGGGPPWQTTEHYLRQSPLQYIASANTPTLVVHSAQDLRCPVEQGEQLYLALKRLGVPTELVRFPNESHGLSRGGRPWHRVFRLDRYLDWFSRWL